MAGERLSKEESIRYLREVHVWIVLMFSASKEIKQDNVGVEFSDQTTPCLSCNEDDDEDDDDDIYIMMQFCLCVCHEK